MTQRHCSSSSSPSPARRRVRRRRPITQRGAGNDSRGAHHVEHARGKAEQEKYNEPPGRDAEQTIDEPAKAGPDQHAANEFAGEPEAPGVARCSRRPIHTRVVGRLPCTLACDRPSPRRWSLAERAASSVAAFPRSPSLRVPSLIASTPAAWPRTRRGRPLKPRGPY